MFRFSALLISSVILFCTLISPAPVQSFSAGTGNAPMASADSSVVPPGSPQHVVARVICDKTARVWWSPPQEAGSSNITAYHIESRIEGASGWTPIASPPANARTAVIDNLEVGIGVSFRIAAENSDTTGQFSEPTEVITPQTDEYSCELQGTARWLTAGLLHTFYMNTGMEREHAIVASQQFGMRWPAIHPQQDAVASKGLLIGTRNFTDESGQTHNYKVIAVGPRDTGQGHYFPFENRLYSRFEPAAVTVNGRPSNDFDRRVDKVDPSLPSDQMVYTRVHTSFGLMLERRNYQWSNPDNDNYHIQEYIFTNNGITGEAPVSTRPDSTLEEVYISMVHRYAPVRQTRYIIGNATGWGLNTMNDRFGDGIGPDYGMEGTSLRGSFSWHGHFPMRIVDYDNIGAPIKNAAMPAAGLHPSDTTGRLGAYHFIGYATLHADTSPTNTNDNPQQPSTMSDIHSDTNLLISINSGNAARMSMLYNEMKSGRTPRHAYLVEPSGTPGFLSPTGNPSRGTAGGFSHLTSYGPYTIAPGESVRIVVAEAVSGISREQALLTGQQFKQGEITALEKNEVVFQGRDSLMQTFVRAKANFDAQFDVPQAPAPPTRFEVRWTDEGVDLSWEYDQGAASAISGFSIWRASRFVDAPYTRIAELGADSRQFLDTPGNPLGGIEAGVDYYYYITADGDLPSGRFFTQTYDPLFAYAVSVERTSELPQELSLSQNYPNPFNPQTTIRYEIPDYALVQLDVYDVMGRRVAALVDAAQAPGRYAVEFNASQLSSGVYVYRLSTGNQILTRKMMLIK
jgi:hypothetical protein